MDVEVRKKKPEDEDEDEEFGEVPKQCQHCHQIGHNELHSFDLTPCSFCRKTNHLSKRCRKRTKSQQRQVNFEWLSTWHWN